MKPVEYVFALCAIVALIVPWAMDLGVFGIVISNLALIIYSWLFYRVIYEIREIQAYCVLLLVFVVVLARVFLFYQYFMQRDTLLYGV